VVKTGEVLLDANLTQQRKFIDTEWLKTMGIKSRLITPLFWNKAQIGIFTLGKTEPNFYTFADAKWLKPFLSQLTFFMLREKKAGEWEKKSCFMEKVWTQLEKISKRVGSQEVLDDICQTITHELPISFCRISTLDEEKPILTTRSVYKIREQGIKLNKEIKFPLSELPWHNLALEERKPLLVNQEDPESFMSEKEAGLILSENINSAILAPLLVRGRPKGIVSLGEMRNWERRPFTPKEMELVEFLASFLSFYLEYEANYSDIQEKEKKHIASFGTENERPKRDWDRFLSSLSYHINNPLASILGSVELLQMKSGLNADEAKRYLLHIEKGAKRIHETLEELKKTENTDKEEWVFTNEEPNLI
jgi:K+-sensing histidine kinase KdpD